MKKHILLSLAAVILSFSNCVKADSRVDINPKSGNPVSPESENAEEVSSNVSVTMSIPEGVGRITENKTKSVSISTFVATVAPDNATGKTVMWKSSDETVAAVFTGVVTAKKF